MLFIKRLIVIYILAHVGLSTDVHGQSVAQGISLDRVRPGYQETVQGEVVSLNSSNPDVQEGLIARCTEGKNVVAWKTAAIPDHYRGQYLYFVWLAGFATGNNRQNSQYEFSINDQVAFNIDIVPKKFPQNWLLKGKDGMELSFVQQSLDENQDAFGYMYLKVPVAHYQKGSPLLLKIAAQQNDRYDDWHITFQHEVKEGVTYARPFPLLREENQKRQQLVAIRINHILPRPVKADIALGKNVRKQVTLSFGSNDIELWMPAVESSKEVAAKVDIPGLPSYTETITLQPVLPRDVYLINHSHTDIGYSDLQPVVIEKHNSFIRQAMQLIDKTKDYPREARFVWNIEAMWAVENFMDQATESEKQRFIAYAKDGSIGLTAGYGNLLTGLCRPEELIHWTEYSALLHRQYGVNPRALMISDVPGMSWNVVSALAQGGVRYVSSGPNYIPHAGFPDTGARVGATHRAWGDQPFYWVSASGMDTVLYWQAGKGYSWFQDWNTGRLSLAPKPKYALLDYMQQLQNDQYPYDMVQLRYSIINDNSPPDENIAKFVAAWNKAYVSPRLIISNVEDMMKTFEQRYAAEIPVVSGDFTPYWEDGALSTAKEEILVKQSVERLYQSEVLSTLLFPGNYDEHTFYKAWRNTIMWHEHTWGAWNSISQPDEPSVLKQWKYKQNFALQSDSLSRKLLAKAIVDIPADNAGFEVINTSSWIRTDLVLLDKAQSKAGDIIVDEQGRPYPSQRLSNGDLAFLAKDIPALGSKTFYNKKGKSAYQSNLKISGQSIENETIRLALDKSTGAIRSLIRKKTNREFVSDKNYRGLNQYIYMPGRDPSKAVSVTEVQIKIKENGPLVSTFEIIAKAPGARQLVQEVSVINEMNKIAISNTVDKTKVREKESVHFAFPVEMPDGQMRLDVGTGMIRPEKDQLPGANKDYMSMQRWVDVSDDQQGITMITNELPLIEVGELVNEMPYASSNSFGGTSVEKNWKEHSSLSNTFFSYVMNNYWYTNYSAAQEGPATFHYAIYLHDAFDPAVAGRLGRANTQPLLVTASTKKERQLPFTLNDEHILLTAAKPAPQGNGTLLRLYNASWQKQRLHLTKDRAVKVYLSNARGDKLEPFDPKQLWPAYALKTLYLE